MTAASKASAWTHSDMREGPKAGTVASKSGKSCVVESAEAAASVVPAGSRGRLQMRLQTVLLFRLMDCPGSSVVAVPMSSLPILLSTCLQSGGTTIVVGVLDFPVRKVRAPRWPRLQSSACWGPMNRQTGAVRYVMWAYRRASEADLKGKDQHRRKAHRHLTREAYGKRCRKVGIQKAEEGREAERKPGLGEGESVHRWHDHLHLAQDVEKEAQGEVEHLHRVQDCMAEPYMHWVLDLSWPGAEAQMPRVKHLRELRAKADVLVHGFNPALLNRTINSAIACVSGGDKLPV